VRDVPRPEKTDVKPPVVIIPSRVDQISAIASAHAPFLYFHQVSTYGATYSILNVTLEANRYMLDAAGAPVRDRVVVAHLRMSVPAAKTMKAAISEALGRAGRWRGRKPNRITSRRSFEAQRGNRFQYTATMAD
jgi:hypothetical protein